MDTQSRRPRESKGRDWSNVSTSQGMPRIAGNNHKLGETPSLNPLRDYGPANIIFGISSF